MKKPTPWNSPEKLAAFLTGAAATQALIEQGNTIPDHIEDGDDGKKFVFLTAWSDIGMFEITISARKITQEEIDAATKALE